jgi:hypothetical protein
MSESLVLVEVERDAAIGWLRQSLAQGHALSSAVLASVRLSDGRPYVLVPEDMARERVADLAAGGVTSTARADQALEGIFGSILDEGGRCLVVEDDLARSRDPVVSTSPFPTAFIDGHVARWVDLAADGAAGEARRLLRMGASGYPLNAFVTSLPAGRLCLVEGESLDDIVGLVVGSLIAIVVAAYDAETFLFWRPPASSSSSAAQRE